MVGTPDVPTDQDMVEETSDTPNPDSSPSDSTSSDVPGDTVGPPPTSSTIASTDDLANAELRYPQVDAEGRVYFTDYLSSTVYRWTRQDGLEVLISPDEIAALRGVATSEIGGVGGMMVSRSGSVAIHSGPCVLEHVRGETRLLICDGDDLVPGGIHQVRLTAHEAGRVVVAYESVEDVLFSNRYKGTYAAVFREGEMTLLAARGDTVPGLPEEPYYGIEESFQSASIDQEGNVYLLISASNDYWAIMRYGASTAEPVMWIERGDANNLQIPGSEVGSNLLAFEDMHVSPDGAVSAWLALSDGAGGLTSRSGIWSVDEDGTPRQLFSATSTELGTLDVTDESHALEWAYSYSHGLVVHAWLQDESTGIWRQTASGWEPIVRSGDTATGKTPGSTLDGAVWGRTAGLVTNIEGAVAFFAQLTGGTLPEHDAGGFWVETPTGEVLNVLLLDEPSPFAEDVGGAAYLNQEYFGAGPWDLTTWFGYPGELSSVVELSGAGRGSYFNARGCGEVPFRVDAGQLLSSGTYRVGLEHWITLRSPAGQDCLPPPDVNALSDAEDASPGDGRCDTGNTTPSGAAECTLRAAIQEANASQLRAVRFDLPGDPPHTIALGSELPAITVPLVIDPTLYLTEAGPGLIVDGSGAGTASGFVVEDEPVTLVSLAVRGFEGAGVVSSSGLRLSSVVLTENCAGVDVAGRLNIDGVQGWPTEITNNGLDSACPSAAGVIMSGDDSASLDPSKLDDVVISGNGGPGIFTRRTVWLGSASIMNNTGAGIHYDGSIDAGTTAVYLRDGDITVSDQDGDGIFANHGRVLVDESVNATLSGNAGWGIVTEEGEVRVGRPGRGAGIKNLSNNGAGPTCTGHALTDTALTPTVVDPCRAGGILARGGVVLDNTTMDGNTGPGVLARGSVELSRSAVRNNGAQGVAVGEGSATLDPTANAIYVSYGPVSVVSNGSDGAYVESGRINIDGAAEVSDNGGWGLTSDGGDALLTSADNTEDILVERNGTASGDCERWGLDAQDAPVQVTAACGGGGLELRAGNLTEADRVLIRNNTGPGIAITGDATVWSGQICENSGGDVSVSGTSDITADTGTCP